MIQLKQSNNSNNFDDPLDDPLQIADLKAVSSKKMEEFDASGASSSLSNSTPVINILASSNDSNDSNNYNYNNTSSNSDICPPSLMTEVASTSDRSTPTATDLQTNSFNSKAFNAFKGVKAGPLDTTESEKLITYIKEAAKKLITGSVYSVKVDISKPSVVGALGLGVKDLSDKLVVVSLLKRTDDLNPEIGAGELAGIRLGN